MFYTTTNILNCINLNYDSKNIYILPYILNHYNIIDNNTYKLWCNSINHDYLEIILEKIFNKSIYFSKINSLNNLGSNQILYELTSNIDNNYSSILQMDNNYYIIYKINENYLVLGCLSDNTSARQYQECLGDKIGSIDDEIYW